MTRIHEVPQLFAQGLALHQKGQLTEAAALYRKILSVQPRHFDAIQLLGAIALQSRDYPRAVELLTKALQINPNHAATQNNRGNALKELGRLDEAVASYGRAIALKPDFAEAYNNRGMALKELGQLDDAVASYDQAIALRPDFAEAHNNRGIALKGLGRLADAIASYDRALALRANHPETCNNRGNALKELGQLDAAVASYDLAIALKPDYAEAHNNRGVALKALKQLDAAIDSYSHAIDIKPDYAIALCNRGVALQEKLQLSAAVADLDRAIAARPDYADAWYNRGIALKELQQLDAAVASYDQAIAIRPDYAEAYNNRGVALQDLLQLEAAIDSYERAICLKPDYAAAHWNLGVCNLLRGDFAQGWPGYEWRWKKDAISIAECRNFPQPLWLGDGPDASLAGKTILLYGEQGLGDILQFCRYAGMVAARGATVILEVQPPLMTLLGHLEGVSRLVTRGEPLPPFDYQCPLMSLPLAFKTDLQTIPASASYLHSDPQKVAQWQERCGPRTKLRIGVVWSGNVEHNNDRQRSIALDELAPLLSTDVEFFSLQQQVRESDRAALQAHPQLRHFGAELADFSDTAALCDLMDLVICVDTSVAHLAGAMGKPLWILLPFSPDWRWLEKRTDSPWYPGAKLYRQEKAGDWSAVIERVKTDLAANAWMVS